MTADLVKFLCARFDEEAALAQAASPGPWHVNAESDEVLAVDGITVADGFALSGRQLRATTEHIARNDPPSVLFDLDIKRRLVDEHKPGIQKGWPNMGRHCLSCTGVRVWDESSNEANCLTLRLLALPYADHPDYREEWKA